MTQSSPSTTVSFPPSRPANQASQINRAKHAFNKNLLVTVINALVFSKLYYCSSLWSNTSSSNLSRLQGVQNFAARVVTNTRKFDHITPILKEIQWLPVKLHLYYRDALLAFKCMNNCAPNYLSSQLITRGEVSSRETRNVRSLDVPLYKTATRDKEHSIIELSLFGTTLALT